MGYLIGIGIAVIIVIAIALSIAEQQQWDAFAAEHECKIVGQVSGSSTTAVGVGGNGQVTVVPVFIPGKTGYACNDGVTYWR